MSPPNYGELSNVLILLTTVVVFTFLFDLADIRPRVGSFLFVRTGTFAIYFLLRLFLALFAAILITTPGPNIAPFLVGFIAVTGSVVLLQGFVLNFAGQDVSNVKGVVETYKDKMLGEAATRTRQTRQAEILQLGQRLLKSIAEEPEPRSIFHSFLLNTLREAGVADPSAAVTAVLKQLDDQAAQISDPVQQAEFKRRVYASQLAQENPEYVRTLLA